MRLERWRYGNKTLLLGSSVLGLAERGPLDQLGYRRAAGVEGQLGTPTRRGVAVFAVGRPPSLAAVAPALPLADITDPTDPPAVDAHLVHNRSAEKGVDFGGAGELHDYPDRCDQHHATAERARRPIRVSAEIRRGNGTTFSLVEGVGTTDQKVRGSNPFGRTTKCLPPASPGGRHFRL